jgi:hypothetical protein
LYQYEFLNTKEVTEKNVAEIKESGGIPKKFKKQNERKHGQKTCSKDDIILICNTCNRPI